MAVPPHPQQQQRQQNHRQQRMQGRVERQPQQEATPDNDRSATELRALDCNLAALCEHIQVEGFNSGAFSDVAVQAMGTTYHLHRLILSRSSFFRNMLHGPWKEAVAPTLTLHIDDDNVNAEAIAATLAYLYGHHPKLSGSNTFRILAAASFLDLQDLCAICTDFIISELWTSNFLAYQVFAESQDYGIHGERVRNACWGYLCQSGAMELREVLPQLSSQTLHALLTSDELWVPNEEKRFELAMYILLAKDTFSRENNTDQTDSNCEVSLGTFDPELPRINKLTDVRTGKKVIDSELQHMSLHDGLDVHKAAQGILVDHSDCVLNLTDISHCTSVPLVQAVASKTDATPRYSCKMENVASVDSAFDCSDAVRLSSPHIKILDDAEAAGTSGGNFSMEGPTDDIACYNFSGKSWLHKDIPRNSSSGRTSCIGGMTTEGVSCNNRTSWDDESIYQRLVNAVKGKSVILGEEHETFINILESSSLLYCHMTFKSLLKVRKQLEELSFPCKAVNDGLWLQAPLPVEKFGSALEIRFCIML